MKRIFSTWKLSVFLLIAINSNGQNVTWAIQEGGSGNDRNFAVAVDKNKNIFSTITNMSSSTTTFDGQCTITGGSSYYDGTFAKLDSGRNCINSKYIGKEILETRDMVIDSTPYVYMTGYYYYTQTLCSSLTATYYDAFIAKYSSSGTCQWAVKCGGTGGSTYGYGIRTDAFGNVYVTGQFQGTATFGSINLTAAGSSDGFVMKLNSSGTVLWAKRFGGSTAVTIGTGISNIVNGSLYITGAFTSTISFASYYDTATVGSGGTDIYLAKLDTGGNFSWAITVGGTAGAYGFRTYQDNSSNVFLAGDAANGATFGNGITSSDSSEFIARFNSSGQIIWLRNLGVFTNGISLNPEIAIYDSTIYFGGTLAKNSTVGAYNLTCAGGTDAYIAKLDYNGKVLWAQNYGGSSNDVAYAITCDQSGYAYLSGFFSGTVSFGGTSLTSSGSSDVFIAKIISGITVDSIASGLNQSCAGSPFNVKFNANETFTSGNVFTAQLSDSSGNFGSPLSIGTLTSISSGVISCDVPNTVSAGSNYRIRIVGSNPSTTGEEYAWNFKLISAPSPTVDNQTVCAGNSATLSASGGGTYNWSTSATTSSISVSTAGGYTVTVTNSSGCTASVNDTLTVHALPTPTVNNDTVCAGSTAILRTASGLSYLWSTSATVDSITTTTAGTYTVTATNSYGCSATASGVVVVHSLPTPTVNNDTVCAGFTATLNATGGVIYRWSNGDSTASIDVDSSRTYTVTVTNSSGCSVTAAGSVIIDSIPRPTVENDTICIGATATLSATGGIYYLWSTGDTTSSINTNMGGIFSVLSINSFGCIGYANDTVTLDSPIIAPVAICLGDTAVLIATGGTSYLWSTGDTTSSIKSISSGTYAVTVAYLSCSSASSSGTVIVNPNPTASATVVVICSGANPMLIAGGGTNYVWSTGDPTPVIIDSIAGTYTVTVTNSSGCSAIASITDTGYIAPSFTIENTTMCAGGSAILSALGGEKYLWSTGDTLSNISVSDSGTYTVTVTSVSGCTASATGTVTMNSNPTAIVSNDTVCFGAYGTLTASGGVSYQWNDGDTSANDTTSIAGTYTVTVTNSSGCTASAYGTINNYPSYLPSIINSFSCSGDTFTLIATGGTHYMWSTGDTTSTISTETTGNYSVTAVTSKGCTVTAFDTITPISTNDTVRICSNTTTALKAPVGVSFLWSTGDTTASILPDSAGTYTVTVTNISECTLTIHETLIINTSPALAISDTVNSDSVTTLTATGGTSYLWSNGDTSASIVVSNAIIYGVTATNADGCSAIDYIQVTATPLDSNPMLSFEISISPTLGLWKDTTDAIRIDSLEAVSSTAKSVLSGISINSFVQEFPGSHYQMLRNLYILRCPYSSLNESAILSLKTYDPTNFPYVREMPQVGLLSPVSSYVPNDFEGVYPGPSAADQLIFLNATTAWGITKGNPNVTIGIDDPDGFDATNPDLVNQIVGTYNNSGTPSWHGTAVAGCAAAQTDNNVGIASIGFNCSLYLSNGGSTSQSLAISNMGYKILNNSWFYPYDCSMSFEPQTHITDELLYDEVYENGTSTCFAAGNGTAGGGACPSEFYMEYPSSMDHNIVVSATGYLPMNDWGCAGCLSCLSSQDAIAFNWAYCHRGVANGLCGSTGDQATSRVSICAPAYNITSTYYPNNYSTGCYGTSFASPMVAGTLGLMLSANSCLSPYQLEYNLKTTAHQMDMVPYAPRTGPDNLSDLANAMQNGISVGQNLNAPYVGLMGAGALDAGAAVTAANSFDCNDPNTQTMYIEGININTICAPGSVIGTGQSDYPKFSVIIENGTPPYTYRWDPITTVVSYPPVTDIPSVNNAILDDPTSATPTIVNTDATVAAFRLGVYDASPVPKVASRNIIVNLTTDQTPKLVMRDSYMDMLNEPNTQATVDAYDWNIWESPDLVSRGQNQDFSFVNQNPVYSSSSPNYINVLIRNVGCTTYSGFTGTDQLLLYWTKAGTGEVWPGDWTTATYTNPSTGATWPAGGLITTIDLNSSYVLSIDPGQQLLACNIPWYPPNPQNYDASLTNVDVCLLGRIQSSTTSPFGMTFPEGSNSAVNVTNNNKIVTRNLIVTSNGVGHKIDWHQILISNSEPINQQFSLEIATDKQLHPSFAGDFSAYASVEVELGDIYDRWVKSGSQGTNISSVNAKSKSINFTGDSKVVLKGITLNANEKYAVKVGVLPIQEPINDQYFHIRQWLEPKEKEDWIPYGDVSFLIEGSRHETKNLRQVNDSLPLSPNFKIYPNPVSNTLTLLYNGNETNTITYSITDVAGVLLLTKKGINVEYGCENDIDMSTFSSGLYFVIITDKDNKMTVKKIVKD